MRKLIFTILILASFSVAAQQKAVQRELYDKDAQAVVPEAGYILSGTHTDLPSRLSFREGAGIAVSDFIPWFKRTFQVSDRIDFKLTRSETDNLGFLQQWYVQTYNGIPVDRAEYLVQSRNGKVTSFGGTAYRIPEQPVRPALNEQAALSKATDFVGAKRYKWQDDRWQNELRRAKDDPSATWYPAGELVISNNEGLASPLVQANFRLAYKFDIHAAEPDKAVRVYVDAATGAVLYTLPLESDCEPAVNFTSIFNGTRSVQTEKFTGSDFRLKDNCLAAEVYIRDWGSATSTPSPVDIQNTTNTWTTMNERFGATVLWETKQSYWYYKNVFGRNSYDNADGDVNGYINAVFYDGGCNCDYTDNASMSFTGGTLKVGLGSSGTLANSWSSTDILGHEYTHAVTGATSALTYSNESGALNESFSDIFGEMIENYVEGSNDWLMGNDRTSGAIRSMANPNLYSNPDTYQGTYWYSGANDNGGVHTNSGVQNFWFYLVAVGGSGTNDNGQAFSVTGIGRDKASAIAFRNLTLKLSSGSDYAAARSGAIEAARDLYGNCSDEVKQVTNAWYAVGVGDPYVGGMAVSPAKPGGFNISCNGGSDGSINFTPAGTGPFTFSWSNGPVTEDQSGLPAGTYTVTVTDATGCSSSVSVTLTEPPVLASTAEVVSDYNGYGVSCNGGSDGIAKALPTGGAPPYSYAWDANAGSQTTQTATNLMAGTYDVDITDANGCMTSASVTLTEPPALSITASPNQTVYYGYPPAACATLSWSGAAGGVPPYTYLWSTGETTQDITVCPVTTTTYSITITDDNNCTYTDYVKVCVIDVRCGHNLDKVQICHIPPGNPGNRQTLCVALSAVATHLAHGDSLGACGIVRTCDDTKAGPEIIAGNGASGQPELSVFPNPFSHAATVTFSVPKDGTVTVMLIDRMGRTIRNLFEGYAGSGIEHTATIEGQGLTEGMYFVVLRDPDGETEIRKVIYIE